MVRPKGKKKQSVPRASNEFSSSSASSNATTVTLEDEVISDWEQLSKQIVPGTEYKLGTTVIALVGITIGCNRVVRIIFGLIGLCLWFASVECGWAFTFQFWRIIQRFFSNRIIILRMDIGQILTGLLSGYLIGSWMAFEFIWDGQFTYSTKLQNKITRPNYNSQ